MVAGDHDRVLGEELGQLHTFSEWVAAGGVAAVPVGLAAEGLRLYLKYWPVIWLTSSRVKMPAKTAMISRESTPERPGMRPGRALLALLRLLRVERLGAALVAAWVCSGAALLAALCTAAVAFIAVLT